MFDPSICCVTSANVVSDLLLLFFVAAYMANKVVYYISGSARARSLRNKHDCTQLEAVQRG